MSAGAGAVEDASAGKGGTPKVYAGPYEAHAAARAISWRARLVPMADGSAVLDAGLFTYVLAADGSVTRAGDDASYVARMPPGDDAIGGYDFIPLPFNAPMKGARDETTLDAKTEIDLPAGIDGGDLRRAADGTAVVIARVPNGQPPVTIIAAPKSRDGRIVALTDLGLPHTDRVRCEHVASWARPHLLCRSWTDDVVTLQRLEGDRWVRVKLSADLPEAAGALAVAEDGALWIGLKNGAIARQAATGSVETITIPQVDAAIRRASYSSSEEYGRPAPPGARGNGDGTSEDFAGARRFERIGIDPGNEPTAFDRVTSIVPRSDGEAWALVREQRGASVLVHLSRPAIAPVPPPIFIGTDADQRNELRNTRVPVAWVGHCATLFVPLAKQRADGSLAAEPLWSREGHLRELVKKVFGTPGIATPSAALVEGKLAGRRVAGVLVVRTTPNTSEELVEKAATAIASEAAEGSGAAPAITCTAPVLERAARL